MGRLGRWLPVLAVLVFLGAAMLTASFGNPTIARVPAEPLPTTTAGPAGSPDPAATQMVASRSVGPTTPPDTLPAWVGWAFSGLCGAGLLSVLTLLAWYTLKERLALRRVIVPASAAPPTEAEIEQQVRAAIDESLAELDVADADPRRAVIACWVRLEAAAAHAGTPRLVGDTSTDLVARLLAGHRVSPEVLAGFAEVYREARYAPHVIDENMRALALAALRQVRDELGTPALVRSERGPSEGTNGGGA